MQSAPELRRTQHATPPDLYADTDLVHGQRCCANQSFCCIRRESASAPAGVLARPALQSRDPGPGNVIDVPAAVSKHLGVLREARLVRVREQGREWHYTLDPGPLEQVYEHWLGSFAPLWDESLTRLKRTAERPPPSAAR